MSDQRDYIEIDDYRVIEVREAPIEDPPMPPAAAPTGPQWSGRVYTSSGGTGCCLGLSATLLLIATIFVLGVCALIMVIARIVGWAIPGL